MRVLEIVHGYPPLASGGTELYARAHAHALQRAGDQVAVLTREADPSRDEYAVRAERLDGIDVFRVNHTFRLARGPVDSYRNPAVDAAAIPVIDRVAPDVVHVHHLTCLSTSLVEALDHRRVPVVVTLHDYWLICHRGQLIDTTGAACAGPEPDGCARCFDAAVAHGSVGYGARRRLRAVERRLPRGLGSFVARLLHAAADVTAPPGGTRAASRARLHDIRATCALVSRFLAPSRHLRDRFLDFGIAPDRLLDWPYGCDQEGFSRSASSRPHGLPLRVGFFGSLMVSKAPHLVLEAVHALAPGTASLDVYGAHAAYHADDRYRHRLAPLLHLPGVRHHGAIDRARVPAALASLDVVVVPSIWRENSPFVIHEAFMAGVPVVAARIGGIPELVQHGVSGLLVEPGDPNALSAALRRLAGDPGLLERLRRGIPAVRTIDDDAQAVRRLYERLLPEAAGAGQG
jgi:glycosyltransferase involved in cell wall biosynthesis